MDSSVGQIAIPNPDVASRGPDETIPSDLTEFLREFWIDPVRVEVIRVDAHNLGSLRINFAPSLFADRYKIEELACQSALEQSPRLMQRGLTSLEVCAYALRPI